MHGAGVQCGTGGFTLCLRLGIYRFSEEHFSGEIIMHIVFLSHYFPPEVNAPASRTYENAKRWVKQGAKVTVITCVPNHPNGVVYPGYANRLRQ